VSAALVGVDRAEAVAADEQLEFWQWSVDKRENDGTVSAACVAIMD